jgi:N-acetylglucosamine-6-phosphate deacetylase
MIIQGKIPGDQKPTNLVLEKGFITKIGPVEGVGPRDFGGPGAYLCEGFFDLQVNGFAGVDFNGTALTVEGMHEAARSLAATGVTRFFPTLISAPGERITRQLKMIAAAMDADPLVKGMCPGIHLEGPYISADEGPRGAHAREFVRPPCWEEVERFQEACGGRIKYITVAPEAEGGIRFIEKATANGMVVGIGHTNASADILEEAARAGARISTHLGNTTPPVLPRHENPIQKQLSMDQLMASIIVDGIHLPDYIVKNFVRAKGTERIILITDSMAGAGAPPGRYTLGDLEVEVKDDRAPRLRGTPRLAGSALTMDRAVKNMMKFAGVDLAAAVGMAGENARKLFPGAGGEIGRGRPADIMLFESGEELVVRAAWVQGEKVYPGKNADIPGGH